MAADISNYFPDFIVPEFAGATGLLSSNRVTFYSNLTDVQVTASSPSRPRRGRYLRGSDGDDFNPPQPSNDV